MKPSFFKSVAIAALPIPVRLFFIGMWDYADDDGRGVDDVRLLKAELFPLDDDVTASTIESWLETLAAQGRIVRYHAGGRRYFAVTNFREHQSISHPQKSVMPAPPERSGILPERSRKSPERSSGKGRERKGEERKGKERKGERLSSGDERDLAWKTDFELAWEAYPKRPNNNRGRAWRAYRARREVGVGAAALLAGVRAYAAHCTRTATAPQFVKLAATFFGPDEHYLDDYGAVASEPIAVYDEHGNPTSEFNAARGAA